MSNAPRQAAPTLWDERLTLRAPRISDRQDRLAIGRHAEFVYLNGGSTRTLAPLTTPEIEQWYERLDAERYGWISDVAGRGVGTARLYNFDVANRSAHYAIGIFDPALWGQRLGTTATRLIVRFAFEQLGLHRISLVVLDVNARAQAAYRRCGFTPEGVMRETVLLDDGWRSDIAMSILEADYRAIAPTGATP